MNKKALFGGIAATLTALVGFNLPADAVISVRSALAPQRLTTPGWTLVEDTVIPINVLTPTLVTARFTAESACYGVSGWCSVVIQAFNVDTGEITEFNPKAGNDFAFDSSDSNTETARSWESHAINRSLVLPPGRYQIYVSANSIFPGMTLNLGARHFEVDR
jgi:hypothetical protein